MDENQSTDRLSDHDANDYGERRRDESAICSFLAQQTGTHPRNVSIADVREFIAVSPLYQPLMEALHDDRCYG